MQELTKIFIVTGPIRSGKTTQLENWCAGRRDTGGLLSPVIDQKRYFRNLQNGQRKAMEAEPGEKEVQRIGRYTFSENAFSWANRQLLQTYQDPKLQFLIIDEIGPLELQGKGLNPALETLFQNLPPRINLILVIREQLLETVLTHYNLQPHQISPFPFPGS